MGNKNHATVEPPAEAGVIATTFVNGAAEIAKPLDLQAQFAADAGAGAENITADALAMPYLKLLQGKSPEVENDGDKYKPGMLYHSVTGKAYDIREGKGRPLHFLQAHFSKQIIEWGDRESGNGGIKGRHECTAQALENLKKLDTNAKGKPLAPDGNGNTLSETAYHFLLLLPEDGPVVGVFPCDSSKLTPSKKLMRAIDSQPPIRLASGKVVPPPTFSKVYSIQSFLDKKRTGGMETFQNVRFAEVGPVTEQTHYDAARAFYLSISGGKVVLDDAAEGATTEHAESGPQSRTDNDGVPF